MKRQHKWSETTTRSICIFNSRLMEQFKLLTCHSKSNEGRCQRVLSSAYDSLTILYFSKEKRKKTASLGSTTLGWKLATKDKWEERNKGNVLCHLTSTHSSLEIPLSITAAHCYNQMCYLRDMWPLVYLYNGRRDDSTGSPGLKKCVYTFSHIKACATLPSAMALLYVC